MSIKALALELYRAKQKVDHLEKDLEQAPVQDRERIESELKTALLELKTLRKMLDGAKGDNPFADRRSGPRKR